MIYLMRHGDTLFNVEGRLLGQTDIPLCPIGVEKVKQAACAIAELNINFIFSSPYLRALQTADILASSMDTFFSIHKDFRERHLGVMDGKFKHNPESSALVAMLGEKEFIPPEGESVDACIGRFSRALELVTREHAGNILIISHGGVISLFMKYVMMVDSNFTFLDNCAFHTLTAGPGQQFFVNTLNTSF